jgi:zinc resistance-associated protein
MWKKVLVASSVLAIAGTSLVYAQRFGGPDGAGPGQAQRPGQMMRGGERMRVTADDLSAFADARVAGVKAGLRLNPDQEKNWPAFEQAWRNLAKLRADTYLAARDGTQVPPDDILERMQRRSDALGKRAAAVKDFTDATAPLYNSLDDIQKRRFAVMARVLRPMPVPDMSGPERRGPGMGPGMRPGGGPGQFQRGRLDQPDLSGGLLERTRFEDFRDTPENAIHSDSDEERR